MCPCLCCQVSRDVTHSVFMAPTAMKTVHQLLREWRGDMKLDRAAVYLSDILRREISRETIRRYEVEAEAPKTLDPVVLAGLARVYKRDPSDLPPGVVEELRTLAGVVAIRPRPSSGADGANLRGEGRLLSSRAARAA